MSDLIRRQDAIDACRSVADNINSPTDQQIGAEYCLDLIKEISSAEPEQEEFEWCHDCKEYDQEQHCCHRWTKVIRQTVEELKVQKQEITAIVEDFGHPCGTYGYCSNCGGYCVNEEPYCPHCGAKVEWR